MTKDKTGRFFIAIIPPSPVYEQALALKNYFSDHYQSKAALHSPPHITLHMPFDWKERKEEDLLLQLDRFSKGNKSFSLQLSGFSCFAPRVIFIQVIENEWLNEMQRKLYRFCKTELNLFNAQYQDQPFHPHLTVAFRDLKKGQFLKAWEEFKEKKFESVVSVEKLTLLKHDGKQWKSYSDFLLA